MPPTPGDSTPSATPEETRAERDPLDEKLIAESAPALHDRTPICVPCQRNYRCERNGILVRLGPDAIISSDMYQCPGCEHQVLKGFASQPVERYGPHRELFEAEDAAMGGATITDRDGHPVEIPEAYMIPLGDAPEAAANQERCR